MKACKTCGIIKSIEDFPKDNKKKDGRRATCKSCVLKSKKKDKSRQEFEPKFPEELTYFLPIDRFNIEMETLV